MLKPDLSPSLSASRDADASPGDGRGVRRGRLEHWLSRPVVPVLWEPLDHAMPLLTKASMVFLQGGRLAELPAVLAPWERGPLMRVPLVLHLDLMAGLSNDEAALQYVAGLKRIDGVITTRHQLVPAARRLGLRTIVRLFLQDSRAVERGVAIATSSRPDAIELLPGVAAAAVGDAFAQCPAPRIAGGLVTDEATVRTILASGCRCVSTSRADLWAINRQAAVTAPSARPTPEELA